MSPTPFTSHLDLEIRNAFNELLALDRLAALPVAGLLRVLKSLPPPLLKAALKDTAATYAND
ncbi:MAG: hypothetical protein U1E16_13825 [Hyphomicrobiales bacterium]